VNWHTEKLQKSRNSY